MKHTSKVVGVSLAVFILSLSLAVGAQARLAIGGSASNFGNTTLQGGTATEIYNGFSTATISVEADDSDESLAIQVTGEASTNIRWVARVDVSQVGYN